MTGKGLCCMLTASWHFGTALIWRPYLNWKGQSASISRFDADHCSPRTPPCHFWINSLSKPTYFEKQILIAFLRYVRCNNEESISYSCHVLVVIKWGLVWIHFYIIELKTMKMLHFFFKNNNVITNSWNVTVSFIKIRDGVFPFTVANSPVDDHVITSDQLPFVCQTIEVTTENEEQVVSSSHSYPLQISPVSSCCGETYDPLCTPNGFF